MNIQHIEEQARFWSHVHTVGHSNSQQCWIWRGACNANGYGVFGSMSGPILSHRYAAALVGVTGDVIRHVCDNPGCVRPSHLQGGTQADNMLDMCVRQRKNSRLNIAAVQDIRTRRIARTAFAKLYNVSEFTIGQVQRRETWQWLT